MRTKPQSAMTPLAIFASGRVSEERTCQGLFLPAQALVPHGLHHPFDDTLTVYLLGKKVLS
eukprot:5256358-Amphidinium_carterae.1